MKITGHRGAKGLAAENTTASLQAALDCGVDDIEIDVRVSRDGQIVLSHDPAITAANGAEYTIALHDLADLQKHKPDLITLETAAHHIDRRVPLCIEVKPGEPAEVIITAVQSLLGTGWTTDDLLLASRDQKILLQLHAALPQIQTIVIEYWSGVRACRRARAVGTRRISMLEYWLWGGFIRRMSRSGYQLYSFPAGSAGRGRFFGWFGLAGRTNSPSKITAWQRAGLAGVITDYPDRYKHRPPTV